MAILIRGAAVQPKRLPAPVASEREELRKQALPLVQPENDPFAGEPATSGTLATMPDPVSPIYAGLPLERKHELIVQWGECVDQWLDAMIVLLDERMTLDANLAKPELQDHPQRPLAEKRRDWLNGEIRSAAEMIADFEAAADRCWGSMTPDERLPVAHAWLTNPQTGRLVGRAWRDYARFGRTWPTGAYVDGRWFANLNNYLYVELAPLWQGERVWLGEPAEIPPEPDTWINTAQWLH